MNLRNYVFVNTIYKERIIFDDFNFCFEFSKMDKISYNHIPAKKTKPKKQLYGISWFIKKTYTLHSKYESDI